MLAEEHNKEINDGEQSGAASQHGSDDVVALTEEAKQDDCRKLGAHKAEHDKKCQTANEALSKRLLSLENRDKTADAQRREPSIAC